MGREVHAKKKKIPLMLKWRKVILGIFLHHWDNETRFSNIQSVAESAGSSFPRHSDFPLLLCDAEEATMSCLFIGILFSRTVA